MKNQYISSRRLTFAALAILFVLTTFSRAQIDKRCLNGEFFAPQRYRVGEPLASGAIADFNRDGKFDVVIADNYSSNAAIFLGDGAGSLIAGSVNYGVGLYATAFLSADFSADERPDLASANTGSADVSLLFNRCSRKTKGILNANF